MYRLNVISHFSAAHQLQKYDGPCKNIHGHNWKVRVGILCENTDEIGLTIDFKIVKKHLNEVMETLDHKLLNELDCFSAVNPTSENIAKHIFKQLQEKFSGTNGKIEEIEVWESEKSSVVYFE
jgi:6-pyruvoyltetrahydropterin/6-carboxytetrahydropterin synthase